MEEKRTAANKKFYTLKSDLMFHIVLQNCKPALKCLIAAVLHIDKSSILSVEVLNPIKEGEHVTDKKVVLDLLLKLNDSTYMNMEMQVRKYDHLPKRSLFYWTRVYDSINAGDDYRLLSKVHQVSILDYVLFEDDPKFYAEYKLIDPESGKLYSDDIDIRVICLPLVHTAESGHEELAYWAELFNAKTYNELESLAKGREEIEKMVEKIKETNDVPWYLSEEEARLDYKRRENAIYGEATEKGLAKGLAEGREKGLAEGREKGLAEGREKGLAEGREKGLAEGRAEQKSIDDAIIAKKDAELAEKNAYIEKLEAALKAKQ